MLKSSSAPTASSSFEGIDNAISCCVTGRMITVTDEQEGEKCDTSCGVARSAGDTSKDRTGFLTAGIRGKRWGEGRSHPYSAIAVSVRPDPILTYTSPPSNHSSSLSLLPLKALKQLTSLFPHETCLKTSFPNLKQVPVLSPNRSFQVLRPRCCASPFYGQFITGKQGPYGVVSVRQCSHLPDSTKVMAPLGACGYLSQFPTRINELQGIAFGN